MQHRLSLSEKQKQYGMEVVGLNDTPPYSAASTGVHSFKIFFSRMKIQRHCSAACRAHHRTTAALGEL